MFLVRLRSSVREVPVGHPRSSLNETLPSYFPGFPPQLIKKLHGEAPNSWASRIWMDVLDYPGHSSELFRKDSNLQTWRMFILVFSLKNFRSLSWEFSVRFHSPGEGVLPALRWMNVDEYVPPWALSVKLHPPFLWTFPAGFPWARRQYLFFLKHILKQISGLKSVGSDTDYH